MGLFSQFRQAKKPHRVALSENATGSPCRSRCVCEPLNKAEDVSQNDQDQPREKYNLIKKIPLKLPHEQLVFSFLNIVPKALTRKFINFYFIEQIMRSRKSTYSEGWI